MKLGRIGCAIQLVDPKGLPAFFFHTFSMALCHKWDVKNDFAYVLQFFSRISVGLGGVTRYIIMKFLLSL